MRPGDGCLPLERRPVGFGGGEIIWPGLDDLGGPLGPVLDHEMEVDEELPDEQLDEPMDFGATADDAYAFLSSVGIVEGLTRDLDETRRAEAFAALCKTVDAHTTAGGVLFGTSAWLITARRP